MTNLDVREASLDDFEELCRVYESDGQGHKRQLSTYPVAEWVFNAKTLFLVAKFKKIAGFIVVRTMGDEAKIDMLSVTEQHQNKGIEQELLNTVEDQLFDIGLKINVQSKDKTRLAMLKDYGFEVTEQLLNLYGKGNHGMVMQKSTPGPHKVLRQKGKFKIIKEKGLYRRRRIHGDEETDSFLEDNLERLTEL